MLGFVFNVLSRALSLMPIIVSLAALYWSKDIFEFFKQYIKIISFARTLPSPQSFPITGCYQFISRTNEFLNSMRQWNRDINQTFTLWIGPIPNIVTTDTRDFEILLMSSNAVEKTFYFYKFFLNFASDPSLSTANDDARYRSIKKLILPYTNGKYISNFIEIFNRQASQFVNVLGDQAGKGEFNIGKNVIHCIGDITYEASFGIPGKAQQGNPDEIILHGTDRMMELMGERLGRIWEHLDIFYRMFNKNSQEYFSTVTYIHKFIENVVEEQKAEYSKGKRENVGPEMYNTLVEIIIKDKKNSWTDSELKNQLIGSIIAMHDTLYGVLSFVYLMLAMHPEVQEKVRQEVINVSGDGMLIDQETTVEMKYTHMVILETLRLFPLAPVIVRETTEELKLATCTLPKGSSVMLFAFGTHRDQAHWTDPEIFNPERFTPENSKNRHKFAFVPFGAGLKKCPGYNFGLTCLKIIIAHTIRQYKFSTSKKMQDIKLYMTMSVRSAGGYPISVEKLK